MTKEARGIIVTPEVAMLSFIIRKSMSVKKTLRLAKGWSAFFTSGVDIALENVKD